MTTWVYQRATSPRSTINDQRVILPTVFEAFQESDYRRFWVSQFFSNVGSWMQTVAQGFLVYKLTDSAFLLGFVGFANAIPAFFLMLWGGVLADRLDRRKVVVVSQWIQALAALALAVSIWFDR